MSIIADIMSKPYRLFFTFSGRSFKTMQPPAPPPEPPDPPPPDPPPAINIGNPVQPFTPPFGQVPVQQQFPTISEFLSDKLDIEVTFTQFQPRDARIRYTGSRQVLATMSTQANISGARGTIVMPLSSSRIRVNGPSKQILMSRITNLSFSLNRNNITQLAFQGQTHLLDGQVGAQ